MKHSKISKNFLTLKVLCPSHLLKLYLFNSKKNQRSDWVMNDFFCFSDIGQFYIAATAQRDERNHRFTLHCINNKLFLKHSKTVTKEYSTKDLLSIKARNIAIDIISTNLNYSIWSPCKRSLRFLTTVAE